LLFIMVIVLNLGARALAASRSGAAR